MLEKDRGGVYIKPALLHGAGKSQACYSSSKSRLLSLHINCAVPCKVFHLLLICGMKPQTSPRVGEGRAGRGQWS